jgi:hypothetical protein
MTYYYKDIFSDFARGKKTFFLVKNLKIPYHKLKFLTRVRLSFLPYICFYEIAFSRKRSPPS